MSTRIALTHIFEQRFDRRAALPTHWLRLRPAPHTCPAVTAYSLRVRSDPHFINWVRDPFENHVARLDLPEPLFGLRLEVELIANLDPINPFDFLTEPYAANFPFEYPDQLRKELQPYLLLPPLTPRVRDWLERVDPEPKYIVEKLGDITGHVHRSLSTTGETRPGAVDPDAVLARGVASPWEAAWLLTLCLRHLGLAARFTSGYRVLLAPEPNGVHAWTDPRLPDPAPLWPDTAALHAWAEVFVPGAGWLGLDPSAGLFTHEGYVPLASTPDPLRALPVTGSPDSPESVREETVRVRRLVPAADPAPYTDAQWAEIRALGREVDLALTTADVNLAMGTTLSFVALGSAAPEWSTTALGLSKRAAAEELLNRMRHSFAPGSVLHEGQGEWFAGENLPRWRLGCFFRADGRPIWRNSALLGRFASGGGPSSADAELFGETLARKLGLSVRHLIPAHEDPLHELWNNRTRFHCEPPAGHLADPERRHALALSLSETRLEPVGYALPLRWNPLEGRWTSGRWHFRRNGLYLMPGDSSMGYRLPLESLSAGEDATVPQDPERCHFEERALLPEVYGELSARLTAYSIGPPVPEEADADDAMRHSPRTALCIQIRSGRLHVFMPPLTHLEHWLDLVGAIEATALAVGIPVMMEGYEPPEDFRLRRLIVEPDAGVLRMTLPMTATWPEITEGLAVAYHEAEAIGLRGERITTDGRRLPPGGSADLVLGAEQPSLSPFLRRPELLRSVLAYWQQHPCLSYLFAGRMIGPSGPAPRPDEGRDDALYELSIALSLIPSGEIPYPWLPDRALRHLLADPAGDMRRAETRIDQLYAPDRSSQRLGRVVIRSLETAPDAKLATAQTLLVRALIAFFTQCPPDPHLIDQGAELHDRFMLPAVLWEDLLAVLRNLEHAGLRLEAEWFEPVVALRFPELGRVQAGNVALELRTAHEPWPLLAEEVAGGGVTRFIDSANERLQVRVTGLISARHALVCNGRRVPLQATRRRDEAVAGVRYKAWNPPATVHPTVPPVYSLVFDLVDIPTGKVLCGCTYFPAQPGLAGVSIATTGPVPATDPGREPPTPRPNILPLPPWSPPGTFRSGGSGLARITVPDDRLDPRYPYLLDLTHMQ